MIHEISEISPVSERYYNTELVKVRQYEINPILKGLREYQYEKPVLNFFEAMKNFDLEIKIINMSRAYYFKSKEGKNDTAVLMIHGGGYVLPLSQNNVHGAVLYSKYADNADVLMPDYTVASQGPHSKTLQDVYSAYLFLKTKYKKIFIAGQSAGGGLAVSLTQYLMDKKELMPKGLMLASPWLDMKCEGESYQENSLSDILFGSCSKEPLPDPFHGKYDDYSFPLNRSFQDFPPVLINVSKSEIVYSDSVSFNEKMEEAGSSIEINAYPMMWHDFYTHNDENPECYKAWKSIEAFVKKYNK